MKKTLLMSLWTRFYQWCEENNIPITKSQRAWIKEYKPEPIPKDTPPEKGQDTSVEEHGL